jgi:HEAT repeat protein
MITSLEDALEDPNPSVRIAAAQALKFLGPRAKSAAAKLTEHTLIANEPNEQMREEAASALKKIVPAETSAPTLAR